MIDMSPDWNRLYKAANEQYRKHYDRDWLVKKSIPILYSGNLAEYENSKRKIVTVSLNPSCFEFLDENPTLPYDVRGYSSDYSGMELEKAYSSYFRRRPYKRWFNEAYEKILQHLDASYYGDVYPNQVSPNWWKPQWNRTLHTDLCTPLVTCPNWSRLSKKVQIELSSDGIRLWRSLIAILKPHLILISVGKQYRQQIGEIVWKPDAPKENRLDGQELFIGKMGEAVIVWGKQQVRPFFYFSDKEKPDLANRILKYIGNR